MTRETILERAESLFMAQGIKGTSIGDIAAAAGISKGTLFYHFRSKDDLILEIAFAHIRKVSDEIFAFIAEGKDSIDARSLVERFLRRILDAVLRNRLHLYLIEESVSRNEKLMLALREKYREWQATMVSSLEPFLGAEARAKGPMLLALTDGLIIQAALGVEYPPIPEMLSLLFPG